ncbi:hypothetical protein Bca4012_044027 [Brassica carinata]|uniref:Uncharacterized protein n=3 Tax=Brassica TaxID=3705 RepID=A0A0D3E8M2_BRAOL|nr:hypothetical protein HID58_087084 [Brassica napus]CAF1748603.1 unnamed protein product [Brassica napus]VDD31290.1 unnamed protein product [Brassica oleracea]
MAIFTDKTEGAPAMAVRGPMVVLSSVRLPYEYMEFQRILLLSFLSCDDTQRINKLGAFDGCIFEFQNRVIIVLD